MKEVELNRAREATTLWRQTTQPILPEAVSTQQVNGYNMYPAHALGQGKIQTGYTSLVAWMITQPIVLVDGYTGILWDVVQAALSAEFKTLGVHVQWHAVAELQKDADDIEQLVSPFIGEVGDVWGTKCTLGISDFFKANPLQAFTFDPAISLHIVIGTGAALTHATAPVVYLDLPKNELQYRMRAGVITNFGALQTTAPAEMYKRFYFVDWPVLNAYKLQLLSRIVIMADTQWRDHIAWMFQDALLAGIRSITQNTFRVRPWFEAGAWGGQWMKQHIAALPKEEVNYAWSFEMIVPENGVVFESDGQLLEVPFEWLMFHAHEQILGVHAPIFQYEFPIRFDFLDTFDGGNLSIQCHPSLDYIQQHFGETITQDETYYILDCKKDASVYLGFQQGVDKQALRTVLESSQDTGKPVEIEQYVKKHAAEKHDLFLIPNGTVHSAGANNLVLEISATPYIFTFKMYDWVRLGLDGNPRSISIPQAFDNLNFSRQGDVVQEELISKPSVVEKGNDWEIIQLSTHAEHFYAIQRLEFDTDITVQTNNVCLIMMLVEGEAVAVQTSNGSITYHYAETFVIPAAAGECRIKNLGTTKAKVIKAYLKQQHYIFDRITSI